jgi:hypothetical protein
LSLKEGELSVNGVSQGGVEESVSLLDPSFLRKHRTNSSPEKKDEGEERLRERIRMQ